MCYQLHGYQNVKNNMLFQKLYKKRVLLQIKLQNHLYITMILININ